MIAASRVKVADIFIVPNPVIRIKQVDEGRESLAGSKFAFKLSVLRTGHAIVASIPVCIATQ